MVSLLALLGASTASAQDVLIRHATVHTAGSQGTLQNTDVLVQGGVIRAVGVNLQAPASINIIEAGGKPLTPALFGGSTEIGIEEVSGEAETVDSAVTLADDQPMRPEFDVTLAYNPDSVLVPIARVEGLGFTLLGAGTGGSFIAGQGGVVRLDGSADAIGPRALFVKLGNDVLGKSGSSRAAQWMLLDQMVGEARGRIGLGAPWRRGLDGRILRLGEVVRAGLRRVTHLDLARRRTRFLEAARNDNRHGLVVMLHVGAGQ